jgi:hypothetical protein
MKYTDDEEGLPVVELTRRNLQVLLAKLDDPLSARGLIDPDDKLLVRAVQTTEERGDTASQAAAATEGVIALTRCELRTLLAGLDCPNPGPDDVVVGGLRVRAVDNDVHYRGRPPGVVWMPSTGELE